MRLFMDDDDNNDDVDVDDDGGDDARWYLIVGLNDRKHPD